MTPQQMVWAREQVIFALNPPDIRHKGQLEPFGDFARSDTKRYGRQRKRTLNIDGRWYCRDSDPVFAAETPRYSAQSEMITPEAFRTAKLRRKIYCLEDYQRAWVLFSYSLQKKRIHHLLVSEFIWMRVRERLRGKRVTERMIGNLIRLTRIVALNAAVIAGGVVAGAVLIAPSCAAQQIDIKPNTWSQHYKGYWCFMHEVCCELDHEALITIMGIKNHQKKYKFAKVNILR
ncbi:TPA: bacteriophage antitermination protein Q [Escherichia coli]